MKDARTEYGDIIDRPHHVSQTRPQMPRQSRAAQFAPFAALTGYDDLINESARETDAQRLPDEHKIEELNAKLLFLFRQQEPSEAVFTVFVPDSRKSGGKYMQVAGKPVRYDAYAQCITMESGESIFIEDITEIACSNFDAVYDCEMPGED